MNTKLNTALNRKIGSVELILIPHRIQNRLIQRAKTSQAKERLVKVAIQATLEEMFRAHVRGYEYKRDDEKHNYEEPSIFSSLWQSIKEWF